MVHIIFQGADFNEQRNPQGNGAWDNGFSIEARGFDLDYMSLTIYPASDPEMDYNHTLARQAEYMNEEGFECGAIGWVIEPEQQLLDKMPELARHIGKRYGRVIVHDEPDAGQGKEQKVAFFNATIVVEFEPSDDDATAAHDALNEYIVEHNISEAFTLEGIQEN